MGLPMATPAGVWYESDGRWGNGEMRIWIHTYILHTWYVCVCVCVCVCACLYSHTSAYIYICKKIHEHMHMHMHIHIY